MLAGRPSKPAAWFMDQSKYVNLAAASNLHCGFWLPADTGRQIQLLHNCLKLSLQHGFEEVRDTAGR
jgi:hypothetical protein